MNRLPYSGLNILLLIIILIAVNLIASYLPLRWDVTEENLYTVSEGTQKIVENLESKVTLKYYFSKSNQDIPPQIKSYAQQIEDLLSEYANLSDGNIDLQIFDPKPDTEEEEWANKYGINAVNLPSGEGIYFGLALIQLDQEVTIPFFDPRREEFLEYDISQALLKVNTTKPLKIGVMSSLPVTGSQAPAFPPNPQAQSEPWVLISELEKNFEVENLPSTTTEIADDITLLLVIHPKDWSERTLYAIDQYVLRGGRAVFLVDPNSRVDLEAVRYGGQMRNLQSNLGNLLDTWGIDYKPSQVIGDFQYATSVNTGAGGLIRYPLWLSMTAEALDSEHPITNQLESLLFIEAGSFAKKENSNIEFTPVLTSSPNSAVLESTMLRFSSPDQIIRDLKPDQETKTIAALVRGSFASAFPNGQPPQEAQTTEGTPALEEEPLKYSHLSEAKEPSTILLIADSDFAYDSFSVQKMNFLGQTLVQPTNDNLNLVINSVEFLSGNDALMSIRSRGRFSRPFLRVLALQQQAQLEYQQEEALIQKRLEEVEQKLNSLQDQQPEATSGKLVLSEEQQQEIKNFREEVRTTKKQLREVRKVLRQDIEALGNRLMVINMLLIPTLVGIAGIVSYIRRNRRSTKR